MRSAQIAQIIQVKSGVPLRRKAALKYTCNLIKNEVVENFFTGRVVEGGFASLDAPAYFSFHHIFSVLPPRK